MKFFKTIQIPENVEHALQIREMQIEHNINMFRATFLFSIAILDIVSSYFIKEITYSTQYDILGAIIGLTGISLVIFIYFSTKKGKKYNPIIKYISVTLDLFITFSFAFSVLFFMDFPIPISKETFVLLITIMIVFFNSLSVLRTDKLTTLYSGILTLILNASLFLGLHLYLEQDINMLVSYTSFLIIILNVFNLWVSDQVLISFIANTSLENANKEILESKNEISEKNEELNQLVEEISTQRDEIESQRDTVNSQKQKIEIIYHEVEQSIDYATKLQEAILPEVSVLKAYFSDNFVFFKPKDKVSGDFYWWANIENNTIITVSDCTGHGVPGAFMSMLGISFLREIVLKEYVTHPGVILRKLRKEIIKTLKQKGEVGEQRDGMDMSLVAINRETNILQFAGANNPLYLIINGELKLDNDFNDRIKLFEIDGSEYKLYEIKGDKMPIALYEKMDKYTTHEIPLEKGDQIYLLTDGFADQFGGTKNKKFQYKALKTILLQNAGKPMQEQNKILSKTLNDWKGDYEQIDDITILGLKI